MTQDVVSYSYVPKVSTSLKAFNSDCNIDRDSFSIPVRYCKCFTHSYILAVYCDNWMSLLLSS